MIDKLIINQAKRISFKKEDITKLEVCSDHIKKNINGKSNFGNYFIGGSFLRGTKVKNVGFIDLFFEYKGRKKPKVVIDELNTYLKNQYPGIQVNKDATSVELKLKDYLFSITPFLHLSETIAIPDKDLNHWELVKYKDFDAQILKLKQKNKNYIKLIKILKLWNKNHNKNIRSKEIEKMVADLFLNSNDDTNSISEWLWVFFIAYGFETDANFIYKLRKQDISESQLITEWYRFIENY